MAEIPVNETARILSEALPFLQRYDDEIIVVKFGGHAMVDKKLAQPICPRHGDAEGMRPKPHCGAWRRTADQQDVGQAGGQSRIPRGTACD